MNWADFSVIMLLLISAGVGFFQGFVKEVFSLLAWLLSFVIALVFLDGLATLLTSLIPFADLRLGLALITLFFVTFILFQWINYLILNSIKHSPRLSMTERLLGGLFGLVQGCVILTVLIMLAGVTQLPTSAWWQESLLLQSFKPIVLLVRSYLPLDIATQFNFEPAPEQMPPSF